MMLFYASTPNRTNFVYDDSLYNFIIFQEKKTLCINSFCKFIRFRLSFCSIPAMTMWARWEERFKMFGANRVNFTTTAWGGNKADSNNTITTGSKRLKVFIECPITSHEKL